MTTLGQIYRATAALGFETALEDDTVFRTAVNRAIVEVNEKRPKKGFYTLHHEPMRNALGDGGFEPCAKDGDLYYTAEGVKSYYFEADGNGEALIEAYLDGGWTVIGRITLASDGAFRAYRGFVTLDLAPFDGTVRLHFTGDYLYYVKCVALYRSIRSGKAEDIQPYSHFVQYDIGKLAERFLALCEPPITDTERPITLREYEVKNRRILCLPRDITGVYRVEYLISPVKITEDDDVESEEVIIDLDDDLCELLPLLVAAYVWADDEEEKARYYLALYRDRAMEIERKGGELTPVRMRSVNGW